MKIMVTLSAVTYNAMNAFSHPMMTKHNFVYKQLHKYSY